ncbi:MAG: transmembrane 220 family protein [Phaeodactylibacter sp.]|nr:transmembrane 220 family protein [Phaeodactylibacter sp.]MCB9299729.1 transmembrane 220 family protein [Lewinellaceae bacterium]HQU57534.1 transmembrane 220 family protein [Saprospiraceae bacterium]
MKIFNLFLTLLFALFAIVQLNDPDPWGWTAMYSFVAIVSGFAAFGRYHQYLIYLGIGVVLIWMATLLPDFINWIKIGMPTITGSMKAETKYVELTREFLGLLLCGLALGWHWKGARRAKAIA